MMKFLKSNPIKVIVLAVLALLALTNCVPQKAHGAVVVARSPVVSVRPSVSVPKVNKPVVKPTQPNTKGMVNHTATAVIASQLIPTVCTEKGKEKNRCVRK